MFPEISVGPFLLRKIIAADQSKIFEGLSHPEVIKYYGVCYATLESSIAQMDFYNDLLTNETGTWWAICYKDNAADLIGACGFNNWHKEHKNIEIGYWLLPGKQGAGIMSKCVTAVIQYAFNNLDIHRIEAVVEDGNGRSAKLLTSLGFDYEGTRKNCEIKNGRFISLQYFALLNPNNDPVTS
ncbi:MAG: GNAT family protein [Ginsengibacter sp.]